MMNFRQPVALVAAVAVGIFIASSSGEAGLTDLGLHQAAVRHYIFASAAYPLAQLLLGRRHGYVGRELNVHTAAGIVIARELGIRVTDEAGNNVNWTPDDSPSALLAASLRRHGHPCSVPVGLLR